MPAAPIVLITGATRGLGRSTARAAAQRGARVLVAGRDADATDSLAREIGGASVRLDLADLRSVDRAVAGLGPVDAVVCNAGTQTTRALVETADGFETTFQVNHLSHLLLVDRLLARHDPPGRVVMLGSSTHDPARSTGTPDPIDGSVASMARAERPAPAGKALGLRDAGLQRYTTSKLLTIATAMGLAREHAECHVSAFDPGLMPGTGLARDFPLPFRLLWASVLRATSVLPFASTPTASGRALARLVTADPSPVPSGTYVDHRLRAQAPSVRAGGADFQREVLVESRRMIREALVGAEPR